MQAAAISILKNSQIECSKRNKKCFGNQLEIQKSQFEKKDKSKYK
jgi:hypothetical protein